MEVNGGRSKSGDMGLVLKGVYLWGLWVEGTSVGLVRGEKK